jgi:hypothetical protein
MGIMQITNIKAAISDGAFGKMSLNSFTLNVILKKTRNWYFHYQQNEKANFIPE